MSINIILTSQAEHLFAGLKNNINFKVFFSDLNKDKKRFFPDGEIYTRLSKIKKITGRTVIIHSGMPNPNEGLVELEMLLEILRKPNNRSIEILFTYFPYGQQDNVFEKGQTNFAEALIKKYIGYYKVKKIFTLDAHFFGDEWLRHYPIENISAVELLKARAKKKFKGIIFCAPDLGCQRRTGLRGARKIRENSFDTEVVSLNDLDDIIKGKDIGVVDDLLETGGTMAKFYDFCKNKGARRIVALITHGVLPAGIERIKKKYAGLYLTNSVNNKDANIDICELIKSHIEASG